MTNTQSFINSIRDNVSNDGLEIAFLKLRQLLKDSPQLDAVLLQSARFRAVMKQIHSGTIDYSSAEITRNQITVSVLELLREIATKLAKLITAMRIKSGRHPDHFGFERSEAFEPLLADRRAHLRTVRVGAQRHAEYVGSRRHFTREWIKC